MKLFDEIKKILASASIKDEGEIEPHDNLETDLGIDSFGTMEIVIKLEQQFEITIQDKELRVFGTVQDVVNFVGQRAALEG